MAETLAIGTAVVPAKLYEGWAGDRRWHAAYPAREHLL